MSKIDRQREHQANERTFLAWMRTSIALIGFGFAIARFGLFLHELQSRLNEKDMPTHSFISSQSLGIGLVMIGIIVIVLAVWRYNQVFWQIERADYRPSRLLIWITAGIVIFLGVLSIPLLLFRQASPPSSPSSRSSRLERQSSKLFSAPLNRKLQTKLYP
ncbi:MAG TPA: DUF202 domain-containing protein [Waterburya sp.]|jgi:putative membrane protein